MLNDYKPDKGGRTLNNSCGAAEIVEGSLTVDFALAVDEGTSTSTQ
jgi:hypothetical protein